MHNWLVSVGRQPPARPTWHLQTYRRLNEQVFRDILGRELADIEAEEAETLGPGP